MGRTCHLVASPLTFSNQTLVRTMSSVSVAGQVAHGDARVDRRADVVPRPGLRGIGGDVVPAQVVLVGHREDFDASVAVDVGSDDVVDAGSSASKGKRVNGTPGSRGVAVPRAPGDEIDPAVAVHVQRHAAHVGRGIRAKQVARPTIGRVHLVPEDVAVLLPDDVFEPPVVVQVGQRGLGVASGW